MKQKIKKLKATAVYVLPEIRFGLTSEQLTLIKPLCIEKMMVQYRHMFTKDKELKQAVNSAANIFPWGKFLGKSPVLLAEELDKITNKAPSAPGKDEWLLKIICTLYPSKYQPEKR